MIQSGGLSKFVALLAASRSKQCFANHVSQSWGLFLSGKLIWDCDFTLCPCVVSQFQFDFATEPNIYFVGRTKSHSWVISRFISFWILMSQIRIWWNELVSVLSGFSGRNGMVPQLIDVTGWMSWPIDQLINHCEVLIVFVTYSWYQLFGEPVCGWQPQQMAWSMFEGSCLVLIDQLFGLPYQIKRVLTRFERTATHKRHNHNYLSD